MNKNIKIGDNVRKLIDKNNPKLGYKYGTIVKIFGGDKKPEIKWK